MKSQRVRCVHLKWTQRLQISQHIPIDDDFEFINLLLNFFNDFPIFSGFVPNAQQLSLLNNNIILLDDGIDPDVNSYNSLSMSCKYYLPDELGERVEKSHMTSNLSLILINARSIGNKLEYIEILPKTIKIILIFWLSQKPGKMT